MGKQIFFTMFVGLFLLLSCTESLEVDPIVNPPKKCTIEISNGPNVTVSQNVFSVVVGESVTFTATADVGYVIDILSINGIKVPLASGLATYTYSFVNVNYDTKISITSKKIPKYNVSVVTDKNVIASYIGSNTDIAPGGSLGINFKISEYYDVDTVLVDGVKASLANMSYSFSDINADHRIKVTSKINSLGIAFNFLTMSTKPFVMDSVLSRNIYKSEWNHNKSVPETVFFYTDQSRETYLYGELIGNGKYFLTDKPLTINFYGDTWRVVKLDENNLWVRAVSLQSKEFKGEEDVEYRYSRH